MASPSIRPSALKGRSGRVREGRRICCDDDDHKIDCFAMHASGPWRCLGAAGWTNEVPICDGLSPTALRRAVQPRGEVLLQIRCRCGDERSSMQFVIVVRGDPGAPSGSVSSKCAARHFRERPGVKGSTSASFWRRRYPTIEGVERRLSSFRGCLRRLATGYVPALI